MANVLIVLDGSFSFTAAGGGSSGFTYTTLVDTLVRAGHRVRKANRLVDTSADDGLHPFTFTDAGLREFDVVWLIGWSGRNSPTSSGNDARPEIGADEIAAIARFMAAGGGVFATGDHDSIGSEMCGKIPRVRAMRCWYGVNDSASPHAGRFPAELSRSSPLPAAPTRRSAIRAAIMTRGDATFVWFENQSDSVPQPITPTTFPAHPILRRGGHDDRRLSRTICTRGKRSARRALRRSRHLSTARVTEFPSGRRRSRTAEGHRHRAAP